jgi:hypothetical protein
MNNYQKTAAFILRIAGCVLAFVGAMGPTYIACMRALGRTTPEYSSDRWAASIMWSVGGVVLVLLSKPLGRLLGRGLD